MATFFLVAADRRGNRRVLAEADSAEKCWAYRRKFASIEADGQERLLVERAWDERVRQAELFSQEGGT